MGTMGRRGHTLELLVQVAAACDAECADELFKVDRAVLVLVEDVEYIVCELAGVTEREELLVYAAEFGPVELAGWTVPKEALVPGARSAIVGAESGARNHCCSSLLSTGMCEIRRWLDWVGWAHSRCSFVDLRAGLGTVLTETFPLSMVEMDGSEDGERPLLGWYKNTTAGCSSSSTRARCATRTTPKPTSPVCRVPCARSSSQALPGTPSPARPRTL